ncbi:MAG: hypothetical protein GFH25_541210n28 [Chloroflexi bacterium AL-N10]|nr:hypothetical protein [Chloroflexi bacterium AL-N1]NOK69601.1 hypothetical protein [Chloroflexi bacterium AL-N10]NOK72148.1 hypothetical protein [Chloroflexi bacterium AL-N5]
MTASVRAYKTVNVFQLTQTVQHKIADQLAQYLTVVFARVKRTGIYQTSSTITLSFAEAIVLIAAGFVVVTRSLTIGVLMGFMGAFWKLIGAANNLIAVWSNAAKVTGYAERMTEFEHMAQPCHPQSHTTFSLANAPLGYPHHTILHNIHLEIRPREKCLIVAPNGCGKSTLALVMSGLLAPQHGIIRQPGIKAISAM